MTNRTIAEFVSQLNSLDVQVFIEGDRDTSSSEKRLRCTAPEGTLTTELRQELADRKAELISYLSQEKAEGRGQKAGDIKAPLVPEGVCQLVCVKGQIRGEIALRTESRNG